MSAAQEGEEELRTVVSSLDLRLLSGLWARLLSLSLASSKVNCKYW